MSSFVAMLKDSYREAVDGWIFAVMLGLAGVLILLVASSSVAPVPADQAIAKMLAGGDSPLVIKQDRGAGAKQAIFLFRPQVSDAVATNPGPRPWEGGTTFNLTFAGDQGGGFGAAGVEVELGEDRKPKAGGDIQQMLILGDPFTEAVRYWATKPGEPKPAYSDELAKEFVAYLVTDTAGLTVSSVAPTTPPEKKDEAKKKERKGGFLGGLVGGGSKPPPAFAVAASGGDRLRWTHQASFLFGAWTPQFKQAPLGRLVYQLENTLLNGIGAWVLLLAGVIVTAGFIPNMLRKGAIDLLLTKPVSRPLILFYKYLGGLLFVFLLTAVTVGGVWVVVGARTGVWAPGLLWCIAGITFYFAILYACSTLVGVLTRNAIVSIVLTIVFWFLVWLIGTVYGVLNVWDTINTLGQANRAGGAVQVETAEKDKQKADEKKADEKKTEVAPPPAPAGGGAVAPPPASAEPSIPVWLVKSFKYANAVTPRTGELDDLTTKLVARDLLSSAELRAAGVLQKEPAWAEVLGVAGGWIVLLLGLATVRFVTRSY